MLNQMSHQISDLTTFRCVDATPIFFLVNTHTLPTATGDDDDGLLLLLLPNSRTDFAKFHPQHAPHCLNYTLVIF